jgi:hypothetical protein
VITIVTVLITFGQKMCGKSLSLFFLLGLNPQIYNVISAQDKIQQENEVASSDDDHKISHRIHDTQDHSQKYESSNQRICV